MNITSKELEKLMAIAEYGVMEAKSRGVSKFSLNNYEYDGTVNVEMISVEDADNFINYDMNDILTEMKDSES